MGVGLSIQLRMETPATGAAIRGLDRGSISRIRSAMKRIIISPRIDKRGKTQRNGKMRALFRQDENVAVEIVMVPQGLRGAGFQTDGAQADWKPAPGQRLFFGSAGSLEDVILDEILAGNKQESGSVIPFFVIEQRHGWTPKRQWTPLRKRSVDSLDLPSSTRECLPPKS